MTDYRNGVRAAAAILLGLVALCVVASLGGCATPQRLIMMNRRALAIAKGAEARCKDDKSCAAVAPCAEAAARNAVNTLECADVWRGDVVDRKRLRIGERLRPCPGCSVCQPCTLLPEAERNAKEAEKIAEKIPTP